jgi:hypothetical protein
MHEISLTRECTQLKEREKQLVSTEPLVPEEKAARRKLDKRTSELLEAFAHFTWEG